MSARAYYNENDQACVAVLKQCIADGVIAPGDIDSRSITDVKPEDLHGYTQCHFFAGGGLWSVAARLAGWADDRPIWTGSCPCQPFSVAGKGAGINDVRHLWPDFFRLIRAERPPVVVGEQVAGSAGYGWLDGVRSNLAGENYASRGVDIPACAVDAPHIRQRLYWCAVADTEGVSGRTGFREGGTISNRPIASNSNGGNVVLVHTEGERRGEGQPEPIIRSGGAAVACADAPSDVGHTVGKGLERLSGHGDASGQPVTPKPTPAPNGSFWSGAEWIRCHDGKARRTEPSIRLLVDGLPGRVGLWRIGGNAIVPILAAEVIRALKEDLDDRGAL